MKVVFLEDLAMRPEKTLSDLLQFLDLPKVEFKDLTPRNEARDGEFLWFRRWINQWPFVKRLVYLNAFQSIRGASKCFLKRSESINLRLVTGCQQMLG